MVNERGSNIGQGIGKVINVSQSGILLETYEFIASTYLFLRCDRCGGQAD